MIQLLKTEYLKKLILVNLWGCCEFDIFFMKIYLHHQRCEISDSDQNFVSMNKNTLAGMRQELNRLNLNSLVFCDTYDVPGLRFDL